MSQQHDVDTTIEKSAQSENRHLEQLQSQQSEATIEALNEEIPEVKDFFVTYFNELGIDPEKDPIFADSGVGSISDWFDSIGIYWLDTLEGSKLEGRSVLGTSIAIDRYVLLSMEGLQSRSERFARAYRGSITAHEVFHTMASVTFQLKDGSNLDSNSWQEHRWAEWYQQKTAGGAYEQQREIYNEKILVDMEKEGDGMKPVVSQDGFFYVNGAPSGMHTDNYVWIDDPETDGGHLYKKRRIGNLLEEGLATIVENRYIQGKLKKTDPELFEEHKKAVSGYLADNPDVFQSEAGLLLGDGVEHYKYSYDKKHNVWSANLYRQGVEVFELLASIFANIQNDPIYFERLFQRARLLAKHDDLWSEMEEVVGKDLSDRIRLFNTSVDKKQGEDIMSALKNILDNQ